MSMNTSKPGRGLEEATSSSRRGFDSSQSNCELQVAILVWDHWLQPSQHQILVTKADLILQALESGCKTWSSACNTSLGASVSLTPPDRSKACFHCLINQSSLERMMLVSQSSKTKCQTLLQAGTCILRICRQQSAILAHSISNHIMNYCILSLSECSYRTMNYVWRS